MIKLQAKYNNANLKLKRIQAKEMNKEVEYLLTQYSKRTRSALTQKWNRFLKKIVAEIIGLGITVQGKTQS